MCIEDKVNPPRLESCLVKCSSAQQPFSWVHTNDPPFFILFPFLTVRTDLTAPRARLEVHLRPDGEHQPRQALHHDCHGRRDRARQARTSKNGL